MAQAELEFPLGIPDKRRTPGQTGTSVATGANYLSVSALRTRLAAANGAYYTNARLDQMTKNDMVYALRTIDDAAGI